MRSRHGQDHQANKEVVKNLQCIIFDFDGVMTNNQALEGMGMKPKWRSHYDGQGVSLLRAIGIRLCVITNERGASAQAAIELVESWNNLPSSRRPENLLGWEHVALFTNRSGEKKVLAAEEWFAALGLSWEVCAVMGDDLVDIPMLQRACFRVAPVSAECVVRDIAHFVSHRRAGAGAVRDFANFVLEVRGITPLLLPLQ